MNTDPLMLAPPSDPIAERPPIEAGPGEVYKELPSFPEQVGDISRTTPIAVYNASMHMASIMKRKPRSAVGLEGQVSEFSEHDLLLELKGYLEYVAQQSGAAAKDALLLLDNLNYVGIKEIDEAAGHIAGQIRQRLLANPDLQVCIPSRFFAMKHEMGQYSSDTVVADAVFAQLLQFDDIAAFGRRLITDLKDITASGANLEIDVLDDWMITGEQVDKVLARFLDQHPEYADNVRIQLVAAPKKMIEEGRTMLGGLSEDGSRKRHHVPISAYYGVRPVPDDWLTLPRQTMAIILGAHATPSSGFAVVMDNSYMKEAGKGWVARYRGIDNVWTDTLPDADGKVQSIKRYESLIPGLANVDPQHRRPGYRPKHLERFVMTYGSRQARFRLVAHHAMRLFSPFLPSRPPKQPAPEIIMAPSPPPAA